MLEKLSYIDMDHTVQLKGRVACEVNTANELVLTELIFENVLTALEPEEIVAVLSALVFQVSGLERLFAWSKCVVYCQLIDVILYVYL